MKHIISILFIFILVSCRETNKESNTLSNRKEYALAIHGGAGTITRENLTPNKEAAYRQKLDAVLRRGEKMLVDGSSSLDVVEDLIRIMENSELFNAGKGAVFNAEGKQDMDASIMNGADLNCGAVAGVSNIKNPISAARLVMDSSEHVFLSRIGAEKFALEMGLEIVEPDYFFDQRRHDHWKRIKDEINEEAKDDKNGTVGVVCLDKKGDLAAGTSTGGMTFKKWGRIGDSPVIGAGTYANNKTCAVSSTGHGEYFIRSMVAHEISAMMEHGNLDLQTAANEVIHKKLTALGGTGGVIAVDANGNLAMPFNTEGMYRGFVKQGEEIVVEIYK